MFMLYSPPPKQKAHRFLSRHYKPEGNDELLEWLRYMLFLAGEDPMYFGLRVQAGAPQPDQVDRVSLAHHFAAHGKFLVLLQSARDSETLFAALTPSSGRFVLNRKRALARDYKDYASRIHEVCARAYGEVQEAKRQVHGESYLIAEEPEPLVFELNPPLPFGRR